MWYHVLYQAVSYLYKQNKFLCNKRVRECSLHYDHDCTKWDLGWATGDVTSGTGLKHSRDFWLSFEGSQNIFGLFVIHILSKPGQEL